MLTSSNFFRLIAIILTTTSLIACSKNTSEMSASLAKEHGWRKTNADCYADRLTDIMDRTSYNRVAELMAKGATFKDALNLTRRASGKSYRGQIRSDATLNSCTPN